MKIFAIGDLHLSGNRDKSMDIFGAHWYRHWEKIKRDWTQKVEPDDVVLVCGDHSWAMRLSEALPDLNEICSMPGKKILLRGNHDYWWSSCAKISAFLFNDTYLLQNNHFVFGEYLVVGARGWVVPATDEGEDAAIYRREAIRLSLSMKGAPGEGRKIVAMMHFPPIDDKRQPNAFTQALEQFGVHKAVYGHLHAEGIAKAFEGVHNGVEYHLVSCDHTDFKLKQIY